MKILKDGCEEKFLMMSNLMSAEFEKIWFEIEDHVMSKWNVGRGRKCDFGGKSTFRAPNGPKHAGG